MTNVNDSWKNKNVFKKQLNFNISELSSKSTYPNHWIDFITLINLFNPKSILDVGCGCGAIYELCKKELPNLQYYGVDYSEDAINLAKEHWNKDVFSVCDYKDLTKSYISNFDLIHLGAVLDVLDNGDEALEYLLSLSPKNILIGRMKITDKDSHYTTYQAYDEITTCAYYHSKNNFLSLCDKYGYNIRNINDNFYLNKKI